MNLFFILLSVWGLLSSNIFAQSIQGYDTLDAYLEAENERFEALVDHIDEMRQCKGSVTSDLISILENEKSVAIKTALKTESLWTIGWFLMDMYASNRIFAPHISLWDFNPAKQSSELAKKVVTVRTLARVSFPAILVIAVWHAQNDGMKKIEEAKKPLKKFSELTRSEIEDSLKQDVFIQGGLDPLESVFFSFSCVTK
ncbi:MAG: hypothetical protein KDD48_06725 [Bdellovibrionales bacterium]|nr:hypothetical protein [Bdellovibrionales bacterium]